MHVLPDPVRAIAWKNNRESERGIWRCQSRVQIRPRTVGHVALPRMRIPPECESFLPINCRLVLNITRCFAKVAGPMWNGPLHSKEFAQEVLDLVNTHPESFGTHSRMQGMLTVANQVCSQTSFAHSDLSTLFTTRNSTPRSSSRRRKSPDSSTLRHLHYKR